MAWEIPSPCSGFTRPAASPTRSTRPAAGVVPMTPILSQPPRRRESPDLGVPARSPTSRRWSKKCGRSCWTFAPAFRSPTVPRPRPTLAVTRSRERPIHSPERPARATVPRTRWPGRPQLRQRTSGGRNPTARVFASTIPASAATRLVAPSAPIKKSARRSWPVLSRYPSIRPLPFQRLDGAPMDRVGTRSQPLRRAASSRRPSASPPCHGQGR